MITIKTKRFSDIPRSLNSAAARKKLKEILALAPKHEINSLYNAPSIREKMKKYFGDKCIFCESIPIASSSFRIDHYRPKKFIKDVDEKDHWGYYWLALEWTNLVQSCELCNLSKSNQFPVTANRVNALSHPAVINLRSITGKPLAEEKRLLLHPELDEVEKHLKFLSNGKVEPANGSMEAAESIKVYGLNRDNLVLMRKKKIDFHFKELIYVLNKYEDGGADNYALIILNNDLNEFFRRLLVDQDETNEYSRLGFHLFHDFETFFVDKLPAELVPHKEILKSFYNKVKTLRTKSST